MNPTQLPAEGTLPLLVLQIVSISGEFPAAFSGRFPGGSSYIESVIGKLKKDGLLHSYTKNGLRGLRLTTSAKRPSGAAAAGALVLTSKSLFRTCL